jgi:hypothetical protein
MASAMAKLPNYRSNGDEPDPNAHWQDFINTSMPEPAPYQMSQLQQDMIRAAGPFQIKGDGRAWADVPELQDIGFHWQPMAIQNIFDIDPPGPLDFTFEEPHDPYAQADDGTDIDVYTEPADAYGNPNIKAAINNSFRFNYMINSANDQADLDFKVPRNKRAKITSRCTDTQPLLTLHEREGGLYFG